MMIRNRNRQTGRWTFWTDPFFFINYFYSVKVNIESCSRFYTLWWLNGIFLSSLDGLNLSTIFNCLSNRSFLLNLCLPSCTWLYLASLDYCSLINQNASTPTPFFFQCFILFLHHHRKSRQDRDRMYNR